MKSILLFFLITLATVQVAAACEIHDLHLSLCELRFNEESSTFEVAVKIFIDDLELALQKDGISNLYIGTDRESELANEVIASYINKHFTIDIDGVRLTADFIGKEITEDLFAVWCYIEFKKPAKGNSKCVMSNRILLDIYADQRNIMDIRMSQTHKDYTIMENGRSTWSYIY